MEPGVSVTVIGPRLETLAWEALACSLPGVGAVGSNVAGEVSLFIGTGPEHEVSGAVCVVGAAEAAEVLRRVTGTISLVSPEDSLDTLQCAIHCAVRRVPFCSPLLYPVLITGMQPAIPAAPESRLAGDAALPLSLRELEVARMVSSGLTNGEVAQALHLSERTIKTHLTRIYGKLGVQGRRGLMTVLSPSP